MSRVWQIAVVLLLPAEVWANALDDLVVGRWAAVGTNTIRLVLPSPVPAGPSQGPDGITQAWNGCIYDSLRSQYVCWGGGHAAYGGNELYAFSRNGLDWVKIWGPSPASAGYDAYDAPSATCFGVYSDGSPDARHNYDGIAYLPPPIDKYYLAGGSRYCQSGGAANDSWWFDPVTKAWTQLPNPPTATFVDLEMLSVWSPRLNQLWFCWPRVGDPCSTFDPVSRTYAQRTDAGPDYGKSKLGYDTKRYKLLAVGGINPSYGWDETVTGTMIRYTVTHTGSATCTTMLTGRPGLQYDAVLDRWVIWNGGSTVCLGVYTGTSTVDWSVFALDAGNTVTPTAARTGGTYGAFQCLSDGICLALNDIDESVYAFRLRSAVGGYPMPSYADETAAYGKWGEVCNDAVLECWEAADFPTATPSPIIDPAISVHNDTEADDLWTYLQQYRRTADPTFLTWATAWRDWWVAQSIPGAAWWTEEAGFEYDHVNCVGLVLKYEYDGDAAALAKAEAIAAVLETFYATKTAGSYAISGDNGMRGFGRHLQCITRLAERTSLQRWINLRDKLISLLLQAPNYTTLAALKTQFPALPITTLAGGMYFMNEFQTDARLPAGSYNQGGRVQSPFHIGILAEGMWHAYRITGNIQIRDRLLEMAAYVDAYGLSGAYLYAGNTYGISPACGKWHSYSGCTGASEGTATFWDPYYTIAQTNLLVMAYKFTGTQAWYDRAHYFWLRGTKARYVGGSLPSRITDTQINHYMDTRSDSATGHRYLDYNKGELQYTSLLFESGGVTIGGGGAPDTSPPTAPSTLTLSVSGTNITLTWTASTDNVGVALYRIERCSGVACTPVEVTTDIASPYVDGNLSSSTLYRYRIRAQDAAGNLSPYNLNGIQEATTAAAPPPGGPFAAWPFGEGVGLSTMDLSGNALTGTLTNGPTWITPAKYGYGIQFDGVNDVVLVPSSAIIDNQNTFEWNGWMYPRTLGGITLGRILHKGTPSVRKKLGFESTNRILIAVNRATTNAGLTTNNNTVALNTAQFFRFTYSEADGPRFYIGTACNAIAEAGYTGAGGSRTVGAGATASEAGQFLYIGNNPAGNEGFDGWLDNLRMYPYIRTVPDAQTDCETALIVSPASVIRGGIKLLAVGFGEGFQ